MNWHYVSAGQPVGPVSESDFERLVQNGTIQPQTLVWNESMTNWLPLSTVKPVAAGPPADGTAGQSEVGSPAGIISETQASAPSTPLPQRILPSDPEALVSEIRQAGYALDIGSCLSRSWELLKSNFWLVVGTSFLSILIQQAAGFIPLLGVFVSLAFYGILNGGLYNFFLKLIRGQAANVGDIFSGFGPRWGQLMLTPIIQGVIMLLIFIAVALVVGGAALLGGASFIQKTGHARAPSPLLFLFVPILLAPIIYLGIAWVFALPLVMDKGLEAWPAMNVSRKVVNLHWWNFFTLMLLGCGIMFAGFLACGVGVFVAIPVFTGMLMYAYEDIFGSGQALGE